MEIRDGPALKWPGKLKAPRHGGQEENITIFIGTMAMIPMTISTLRKIEELIQWGRL